VLEDEIDDGIEHLGLDTTFATHRLRLLGWT